jgi:hypothetical protein
MREICTSGSEGGGIETNRFFLPLSQGLALIGPSTAAPLIGSGPEGAHHVIGNFKPLVSGKFTPW